MSTTSWVRKCMSHGCYLSSTRSIFKCSDFPCLTLKGELTKTLNHEECLIVIPVNMAPVMKMFAVLLSITLGVFMVDSATSDDIPQMSKYYI